jgi:hypothetical protein
MRADADGARRAGLLARGVDSDALARSLLATYIGAEFWFASAPDERPLLQVLEPMIDAELASATRGAKKRPRITA